MRTETEHQYIWWCCSNGSSQIARLMVPAVVAQESVLSATFFIRFTYLTSRLRENAMFCSMPTILFLLLSKPWDKYFKKFSALYRQNTRNIVPVQQISKQKPTTSLINSRIETSNFPKLSPSLDSNNKLRRLPKSVIQPIMMYGCPVWHTKVPFHSIDQTPFSLLVSANIRLD